MQLYTHAPTTPEMNLQLHINGCTDCRTYHCDIFAVMSKWHSKAVPQSVCARTASAAFHWKPHLPPKVGKPGMFGNPGMLGKPVGKLGTIGMSVGKLGKVGVPFPPVGGPAGMPVGRPGMLGTNVGMVLSVGGRAGVLGKPVGKLGMPGIP
jgi:hypothetical protein